MLKISQIILILLLVLLTMPLLGLAEPTYDEQGDLILPNSEKHIGTIDGIYIGSEYTIPYVIIDDLRYHFDDKIVLRKMNNNLTVFTHFREGMKVEFYALDNKITKLKEIQPDEEDNIAKDVSPEQTPGVDGMKLENGVWVN